MKQTKMKFVLFLILLCSIAGLLLSCETTCTHQYENGVCIHCGNTNYCLHENYENGMCVQCQAPCSHLYENGVCQRCDMHCIHSTYVGKYCSECDQICPHENYIEGICEKCGHCCSHSEYELAKCVVCGMSCDHFSFKNATCLDCGFVCTSHQYQNGACKVCKTACPHTYINGVCTVCGFENEDYAPRELPFKKGMNLSGFEDPQKNSLYILNSSTYSNIKSQGFDHVRLPVDFRLFYNNGFRKTAEECWATLDSVIAMAEEQGLYILIDFHGWYDINTNDTAQKEQYLSIITTLAERYQDSSDYVVFELINEPHTTEGGNLNAQKLNELQNEAISIIRKTNPNRWIVAACAEWNGSWMLDKLSLPKADKKIAVAVHTYEPMEFTHQGCTWWKPEATYKVALTEAMLHQLDIHFERIKQFTERTGIPVILNEFGLNTSYATSADITAYLSHITTFCEEYNIAFTYWEYNQGFGAYKNGKWNQAVLAGIFPKKDEE